MPLRSAPLIALFAGALASVGFMLYAGRHNTHRLLLVLFALWILGPFLAVLCAHIVSPRWSEPTRATLRITTLVLAAVSLALYGYVALNLPLAKATPVFVVTPPLSCLVIGIALLTAARRP